MTPADVESSVAATEAAPPSARGALRDTVHRIAWEIENDQVSNGDLSALRRIRPGDIGGPAFWKLAVRHLEPTEQLPVTSAPWREDAERRWSVILGGMAEVSSRHRRGARLGRVLAQAEVSEARVLRLLRARGESLWRASRALSHQLASGGHAVDWADLAELIVSDGAPWEASPRRSIALDYYRFHRA